jgi:hypothetical protein
MVKAMTGQFVPPEENVCLSITSLILWHNISIKMSLCQSESLWASPGQILYRLPLFILYREFQNLRKCGFYKIVKCGNETRFEMKLQVIFIISQFIS